MKALSVRILLLFVWQVVASALPEIYLIGEKEQHCFYIHAKEKELFKAKVFVFHGGSRDIEFSVSYSSQGRFLSTCLRSLVLHHDAQPTLAPNVNINTIGVCASKRGS